ncbi:MAG: addiction module protein [Spirochaetia bacterium]|nr:addiction module protein [Spirochaetia bacterium]
MKMKQLIHEVESLPVEERAFIADSLLRGLNQPETEVDKKWLSVAQKRLKEKRAGKILGKKKKRFFEF